VVPVNFPVREVITSDEGRFQAAMKQKTGNPRSDLRGILILQRRGFAYFFSTSLSAAEFMQ
jgi:hypothetical protein